MQLGNVLEELKMRRFSLNQRSFVSNTSCAQVDIRNTYSPLDERVACSIFENEAVWVLRKFF